MARAYFNETQRFRQWWIYIIIVLTIVSWGYVFFASTNSTETEESVPGIVMIFAGLIPFLLIVLLMALRLETKIRNDGLSFRFKPLQLKEKNIKPDEILSFEVRKYKPLMEYGGWGVKTGRKKYGKAYNVSGNMGLQLYLKSGKKLLIGTQKPREIQKAMEDMMAVVS